MAQVCPCRPELDKSRQQHDGFHRLDVVDGQRVEALVAG